MSVAGGKRPAARPPVKSGTLDAVFHALSHSARRHILLVLHARGGEMTAGEINDRFKHSWPTTTRHLGVLRMAGLVRVEGRGRLRLYSLANQDLVRTLEWMQAWVPDNKQVSGKRAEWAGLTYAAMRNATPPRRRGEEGKG